MAALNGQTKACRRAIPEIAFCEEKQRLLAAFSGAAYKLTILHTNKSDLVMRGNPGADCYDEIIEQARLEKDYAKYAYLHHVTEHGCGSVLEQVSRQDICSHDRN